MEGAILVLDTGSPRVSVAVASGGADGEILAARDCRLERSSTQLLGLIDEVLRAAALRPRELAGIAALRGPGSFTGLRVGLSTALGLHQALALPASAITTFQALAAEAGAPGEPVLAVVDALRGEWSAQAFPRGDPGEQEGEPRLLAPAAIAELAPLRIVGFGFAPLRAALADHPGLTFAEAGPLAGPAALWILRAHGPFGPEGSALLGSPLYSRPPAVTLPKPRRPPVPAA